MRIWSYNVGFAICTYLIMYTAEQHATTCMVLITGGLITLP